MLPSVAESVTNITMQLFRCSYKQISGGGGVVQVASEGFIEKLGPVSKLQKESASVKSILAQTKLPLYDQLTKPSFYL